MEKKSCVKERIGLGVLSVIFAVSLLHLPVYGGTCEGLIGNLVWYDENCDGIQNTDEIGIADVTVYLKNHSFEVAKTTTEQDGYYEFSPVCAEDGAGNKIEWTVEVAAPAGYYKPTQSGAPGSTAENDSDNPSGTIVILPDNYSSDETIDFGYCLDCGDCEGKVTELTLQYIGDMLDANIVVSQKEKKGGLVVFNGIMQPDELFTFIGVDKKGTLGTEISIYVNGTLNTKIHTSCSKPIGPGLISGDFEVIEGYSRNGGALCPVTQPPDDCKCEGKVTELTLQYIGDILDPNIVVSQKEKKGGLVVFDGIVQPDELFTFTGTDKKGTLGTEISIYVNDTLNTEIHTSCSKPIGPGLISGDFEVIEGYSRNGGALCPLQ